MQSTANNRLTAHWGQREKLLEVAYLNDDLLRIERFWGESELVTFCAALDALKPRQGVEVQASWIWPYDFLPQLAAQRAETLLSLKPLGGKLREHSLPHVQSFVQSAMACARRRPTAEFVAVTLAGSLRGAAITDPRQTRHVNVGMPNDTFKREARTPKSARELLTALKEKFDFTQPARPWMLFGQQCTPAVPALADEFRAEKLIVPAHSGAVKTVELLMSDYYLQMGMRFDKPTTIPGDPTRSEEDRIRVVFRNLMDEVSRKAFKLGFDTDDLVCQRVIAVRMPSEQMPSLFTDEKGGFISQAMELCNSSGYGRSELTSESRPYICGLDVCASIETPKPSLPSIAISTTFVGAGEPKNRIVVGPGKMLACLCDIDVPAGWRAEWEPCGDVVMTRV